MSTPSTPIELTAARRRPVSCSILIGSHLPSLREPAARKEWLIGCREPSA